MERQFVASVYIIDDNRILLIYHRKLCKWLPPGGHLNPNETPAEGARREVREETGLEIEFILQENIWINRWNASSFERPFLCLLEEIPAFGSLPPHQHIDMVYVARPKEGVLVENEKETAGIKWFSMQEIDSLKPDIDIFIETKEVIYHLLNLSFECIPIKVF
jgi:ADP-ribose pyrophosphatase YjhB (NUDIX family)